MPRVARSSVPGPREAVALSPDPADSTAELAARMVQSWREGEHILAEAILNERPKLWKDPEAALELIYEELCLREEWAVPATLDELCRRFPQWQSEIEVLFRYQRLLTTDAEQPRFPGPGDTVGEFLLIAEMGRGAQGRVFLACQPLLGGREVVLKIVRKHNGEHLRLARLQHTHIVPLYSAADDPQRGLHVLCMPYFAGASLAQLLEAMRRRPLSEKSGRFLLATLDQINQDLTRAMRRNCGMRPLGSSSKRHLTPNRSAGSALVWLTPSNMPMSTTSSTWT